MHALPEFSLHRPGTLAEAAALLAAQPAARIVAGGTDLLPNLRRGLGHPPALIDLSGVSGFDVIHAPAGEALLLGAGVTLAALAADTAVAARWPALGEAARGSAGPGHRSAATLGGNLCQDTRCVFYNQSEWWRASNDHCLKHGGATCHVAPQGEHCHAAFCSDLAPVLLVLQAQVELQSAHGTRWLALPDLYRDDGAAHLALQPGEVLARVRVPAVPDGVACCYRKARVRGAMDFPLAGVAIAMALEQGCIQTLAVALTGTNSQPLLLAGTGELAGRVPGEELAAQVGKLVRQQVSPMRSTVTPSNYRRQVAAALVQRMLLEMAGSARARGAA
jgi:4-hydroxybenzoyl-CoA reductase subunit beta